MAETAKLNVTFTADTKDFERGVDNVNKGLDNTKRKSESAFDRVSSDMRKLGANLLKVAVPLDALFVVAIKSAVEFDEQMVNIASVMGLTKKQTSKMADELMALSKTSKFSGTQLATAMYDVVGGVADATKHMDILASSVALAEANNADLTASNKALISTYNAYATQGVDVTRISDVMTQTIKQGVGTMDELAAVFAKTAGLASPLGIDIEELGLMFADMSTKGVTFAQAGTQIESALGSLLNPTKELEAAFAQMGMTQADVLKMLEEQGLVAVINEMTKAGVDLTQVFGNKEALLGVLAIAGMDSTALETFTKNATGATDATRELAKQAMQFQLDKLSGDMSDLAVTVGTALLPALSGVVDDLSPIVQGFADWAKENPQVIQDVAKLAVGATLLGAVLFPLSIVTSTLGTVMTGLKIALQGVGIAGVLATGPLGAIVLGATLGIAVFKQFEDGLTSWGENLRTSWGVVVSAAEKSGEQLSVIVWKMLADMTNNEFFTGVRTAFEGLWNGIKGIAEGAVNGIVGALYGLRDIVNNILTGLGIIQSSPIATSVPESQPAPTPKPPITSTPVPVRQLPIPNLPTQPNTRQKAMGSRATGGSVFANKPYIVGERGREIFTPNVGGMITPNRKVDNNRQVVINAVNVYGVQDINGLVDQIQLVIQRRGA